MISSHKLYSVRVWLTMALEGTQWICFETIQLVVPHSGSSHFSLGIQHCELAYSCSINPCPKWKHATQKIKNLKNSLKAQTALGYGQSSSLTQFKFKQSP